MDRNIYLEIYIEDDGEIIITPLTNDTQEIFKAMAGKEILPGTYCG
jgi:hypothetical protein